MKEYFITNNDNELSHIIIGKTNEIKQLYKKLLNEAEWGEYYNGFNYEDNPDNMPSFSSNKMYYGIDFDENEKKFYIVTNDYICSEFEQAKEIKIVKEFSLCF